MISQQHSSHDSGSPGSMPLTERQMTSQDAGEGISRRTWLAVSGVSVVSVANGDLPAAVMENRNQRSIDAHVHVWTPDTKQYPLDRNYTVADMQPPSFTPQELMAHASQSNVDRVVLIQMSFYGVDNSYMLDVIENQPQRYSGVAVIDSEDRLEDTIKDLKAKGVRGFRIVAGNQNPATWLKGKSMKKMWGIAADMGMAICPLMNPQHIDSINKMCRQYPRTRVVVDHFARIGVTGKISTDALGDLCRLAHHKNVYVKTSAFYALGKKKSPYMDLGPMIQKCRDAFGSQRLMWATDCPYQVGGDHTYADSMELVRSRLKFRSAEDRQWMLEKTAQKVFFS